MVFSQKLGNCWKAIGQIKSHKWEIIGKLKWQSSCFPNLGNNCVFCTPILGTFLESQRENCHRNGKFLGNWNETPVLSQIWEIIGVFFHYLGNCWKAIREVKSQKWDILGKINEQLVISQIWKIIGYFFQCLGNCCIVVHVYIPKVVRYRVDS